jgi:CheY-like chemotaxis protein
MARITVLVVDDDPDICAELTTFLQGEDISGEGSDVSVTSTTDFAEALNLLDERQFELIILDLRNEADDEAGLEAFQAIRARRFLPVIFYTNLPYLVSAAVQTPLVRVIRKTDGLLALLAVVRDVFATKLPSVNRALIAHLQYVQRDYMWTFVAEHWAQFGAATDKTALAFFLARRLAMSLSGAAVDRLVTDLGGEAGAAELKDGRVHPMRLYVIPPLTSVEPRAGDIFEGEIRGERGFWILLTPSCDLAQHKADRVLLARCDLLNVHPEYTNFTTGPSNGKRRLLGELLRNGREHDRTYFLPAVFDLPDLVVDLQHLAGCERDELEQLGRTATLDSPYAEALVARFMRYFGRLGTPDLDVDSVLDRVDPRIDDI